MKHVLLNSLMLTILTTGFLSAMTKEEWQNAVRTLTAQGMSQKSARHLIHLEQNKIPNAQEELAKLQRMLDNYRTDIGLIETQIVIVMHAIEKKNNHLDELNEEKAKLKAPKPSTPTSRRQQPKAPKPIKLTPDEQETAFNGALESFRIFNAARTAAQDAGQTETAAPVDTAAPETKKAPESNCVVQ